MLHDISVFSVYLLLHHTHVEPIRISLLNFSIYAFGVGFGIGLVQFKNSHIVQVVFAGA